MPKFLIADDGNDRDFVIHCHWPRFIMEIDEEGVGVVRIWLDPETEIIRLEQKSGREPAVLIARLMKEAGEFFMDQIEE